MIRAAKQSDVNEISQIIKNLAHCYLSPIGNKTQEPLPTWFRNSINKEAIAQRIDNSEFSYYTKMKMLK